MAELASIVPDNPINDGRTNAMIQPQPEPIIEAAYICPEFSGLKEMSKPTETPLKKNGAAKIMKWDIRMNICAGSIKTV